MVLALISGAVDSAARPEVYSLRGKEGRFIAQSYNPQHVGQREILSFSFF
jgi:hypothetical protein